MTVDSQKLYEDSVAYNRKLKLNQSNLLTNKESYTYSALFDFWLSDEDFTLSELSSELLGTDDVVAVILLAFSNSDSLLLLDKSDRKNEQAIAAANAHPAPINNTAIISCMK